MHASYAVSLQLAKAKRPFVDGTLVKQCATEMAKAFGEMKIAEKFETVALSRPTVQRRIEKLGEKVEESLVEDFKECSYFSLCLDESTDETDVSQLIIVARIVQKDFSVREEVFDLCPLHGTTKGSDIYEALKTSVKKLGNWEKCSVIVTDGAPAMLGEKTGLVGLLKKDGITCPTLHCIIHQEALCSKEIKKNETFKTVVKIINTIRGGNKALLHRLLRKFLDEMDADYDDLPLYNQVRWLSAGKSLESFFGVVEFIPTFLKESVKADTTELEEKLQDPAFLTELAYLTDLTNHLNELNLKLQGKNKTVSHLMSDVNAFRSKLRLLKIGLEKSDLTHFATCRKLVEDFELTEHPDFSKFSVDISDIMDQFSTRFQDFQKLEESLLLFTNPLTAEIDSQEPEFQMELCELQADMFLRTRRETGPDFFKLLRVERFPNLRKFGLKMTSMLGSMYMCESAFSTLNGIKNKYRTRLSESSLLHLMRLATTDFRIDISALVNEAERPQASH